MCISYLKIWKARQFWKSWERVNTWWGVPGILSGILLWIHVQLEFKFSHGSKSFIYKGVREWLRSYRFWYGWGAWIQVKLEELPI